jgi:hypothetical protein
MEEEDGTAGGASWVQSLQQLMAAQKADSGLAESSLRLQSPSALHLAGLFSSPADASQRLWASVSDLAPPALGAWAQAAAELQAALQAQLADSNRAALTLASALVAAVMLVAMLPPAAAAGSSAAH